MTTSDEALAEALERHRGFINYGKPVCKCGFGFSTWLEHRAHIAERILASDWLAAYAEGVRVAERADAWDEGYGAGQRTWAAAETQAPNPYRAEVST